MKRVEIFFQNVRRSCAVNNFAEMPHENRPSFAVKISDIYEYLNKDIWANAVPVVQTSPQMVSAIFAGDPIITSRVLMCDNRY